MKMMKVYDCQEMPENVRKEFYANYSEPVGNGSYVKWNLDELSDMQDPDCGYEPEDAAKFKLVCDWLIANGAGNEETVLISYWW